MIKLLLVAALVAAVAAIATQTAPDLNRYRKMRAM
jgi:hypothetical protein